MTGRALVVAIALGPIAVFAQAANGSSIFAAKTTLPIAFTRSISADHAHSGDPCAAKTMQAVKLSNGTTLRSGAQVTCHVVQAVAFRQSKVPYARNAPSSLVVQFDSVDANGVQVPLRVAVRALADVFATTGAEEPHGDTSLDPQQTLTLVGGERLVPSQLAVRDYDGDVVAYHRRDGVYGRLIANGACDGNSFEVSLGIFSASACGLYGYTDVAEVKSEHASASTLQLVSRRVSPTIWKHSTALLEVLPEAKELAGR